MKTILLSPPFCTPASPPYSLVKLYWFLRNNLEKGNTLPSEKNNLSQEKYTLQLLDLNLSFHNRKWKRQGNYFRTFTQNYTREEYDAVAKAYLKESTACYAENNKKVIRGEKPELFQELLQEILEQKPDLVAMSVVYSSQVFYAYALLQELQKRNIKTIIGGPGVNKKLQEIASITLKNEIELLEAISGKKYNQANNQIDNHTGHEILNFSGVLDFSVLPLHDYFVPEAVLPLRTAISCYYQQCVFCTHHGNLPYQELSLEEVKKSIIISGAKKVFFMDDMIHKKRLLEIAALLGPLQVSWMCQLRPMKDLDGETLKKLHEGGLKAIIWGLESGSDRILQLMKKGTNIADAKQVLKNSAAAGIKNCLYIMFGFPTETRKEFKATLALLREQKETTILVLSTIFGLQHSAPMYEDTEKEKYGIEEVHLQERTLLEPKITYTVKSGLTQEEATALRKRYKKFLDSFAYPSAMNFFREHVLCVE